MSRGPCVTGSITIATAPNRCFRRWLLRRKINLLIAEWKAAGGGDVLPDVRDRVRLRPEKKVGNLLRAVMRR